MPCPGRLLIVIFYHRQTGWASHRKKGRQFFAGIISKPPIKPICFTQRGKPKGWRYWVLPGKRNTLKTSEKSALFIFCRKHGERAWPKKRCISAVPTLRKTAARGFSFGCWRTIGAPAAFMKKADSVLMEHGGSFRRPIVFVRNCGIIAAWKAEKEVPAMPAAGTSFSGVLIGCLKGFQIAGLVVPLV